MRCCKKYCEVSSGQYSWLCPPHQQEWEESDDGKLSRELTIKATESDIESEMAEAHYSSACDLYKKYILHD